MTARDFQLECENAITGQLFDPTFSVDYTEDVELSVREMREICNTLRTAQGMEPLRVVEPYENGGKR